MELDDEIEALRAIFAQEGELEVTRDRDGRTVLQFHLTIDDDVDISHSNQLKVDLSLTLLPSYPKDPPSVCISSSQLTRETQDKVKNDLGKFIKDLPSEPVSMEIVFWIKEHIHKYVTHNQLTAQSERVSSTEIPCTYAVLHLDHMRAKQHYVKTLLAWAEGGSLTGRVVFCKHLIFIILIGMSRNVKDFIVNLKTQTVDVDSSGRSCKEKMMSVISEGDHSGVLRQSNFTSVQCESVDELETVFKNFSLEHVYKQSIQTSFLRNTMDQMKK